jgi:putative membrane protein
VRPLLLPTGILLLLVIWFGPLLGAWRGSFTTHMLAHMGVIAIAAPLIAIGMPERWRPGPSMPAALPVLASVMELLAVWAWHAPAMRAASESSVSALAAEQATFLIAGIALWWTSFAAPGNRAQAAAGAGALLLTSIHMTLLGALLALSPRPLYGVGEATCFGIVLSGGQDQQIGGVVMLLVGAAVYLAGGLYLVAGLLSGAASSVVGPKSARANP